MSASKPAPPAKLRVLFVCIGNSCRSPMAESIALRDYSDLFEVSSAGIAPLGVVQHMTLEILRANGYPADGLSSKSIRADAWSQADIVVNMSGYHHHHTFPQDRSHKIEDWEVDDPFGGRAQDYQRTFDDLRSRIDSLAKCFRK